MWYGSIICIGFATDARRAACLLARYSLSYGGVGLDTT